MKNPNNILITGANSGIGFALAEAYADKGIRLFLSGRNESRLDAIKRVCEDKGAEVYIKICDVTDKQTMFDWIGEMADRYRLDVVIANAGISAGTAGGVESYEQIKNICDTNIYGVINTVYPAMLEMRKRCKGQIVIISSLAGYRGLPSSPAYSASKAAVKLYGEATRGALRRDGVGVTVVTPGYIKTPMTDVNSFYMPFLMDARKAAKLIVKKLQKNPARIAFPLPLYFIVWLASILPPRLTDPIFSRLPGKAGLK